MKRLILTIGLLLCLPYPVNATWSLTQVKGNTACSANPCNVTVTSTGAGHLLIAGVGASNTTTPIGSVAAGTCNTTWTHAPNANGSGTGSTDIFYCTNSVAAQTTVAITCTGNPCNLGVVWEAASTLGNIAIDSGATPSQTHTDTTCTSCAGTALTLSGNNDFIAAIATCASTCTGLTGTGWTNDLLNPLGDGVGHGITNGSQTAPTTWTQSPTGTMTTSAAAFQETASGGAASGFNKRRQYERLEE